MAKGNQKPKRTKKPADNVQHPGNNVQHPGNNVQHPGNDVQHPGPRIKRRRYVPGDNVQHPGDNVQHPGGRLSLLAGFQHPDGYVPQYWTAEQVEKLVAKAFPGRWTRHQEYYRKPILGDAEYYLPTEPEVRAIVKASLATRARYAPGVYDCEDFAFVLKSHFCQAAYLRNGELGSAYCMGIVWGEGLWTGDKGEPHAMNWVITSGHYLLLIEPQTGDMRWMKPTGKADNGVYLLLA